jgi:hypothetical protein
MTSQKLEATSAGGLVFDSSRIALPTVDNLRNWLLTRSEVVLIIKLAEYHYPTAVYVECVDSPLVTILISIIKPGVRVLFIITFN